MTAWRARVPCFLPSRRRHTRCLSDWNSDVCSSDLIGERGRNRGTGVGIAFGLHRFAVRGSECAVVLGAIEMCRVYGVFGLSQKVLIVGIHLDPEVVVLDPGRIERGIIFALMTHRRIETAGGA